MKKLQLSGIQLDLVVDTKIKEHITEFASEYLDLLNEAMRYTDMEVKAVFEMYGMLYERKFTSKPNSYQIVLDKGRHVLNGIDVSNGEMILQAAEFIVNDVIRVVVLTDQGNIMYTPLSLNLRPLHETVLYCNLENWDLDRFDVI